MEELAKALAEAVKSGAHMAQPALIGYYVVRFSEALFPVIGWIVTIIIASKTILQGMKIGMSEGTDNARAKEAKYKAWKAAYAQGYREDYQENNP